MTLPAQILQESRQVLWEYYVETFRIMRKNLSYDEREYIYGRRYAYGHALYLIDSPENTLVDEYQSILGEAAIDQVQAKRGA